MPATNGTQNWKIFLRADVRYVKCAMLVYPAILWLIDTDCFTTDGYWTKMSPCNHHLIFAESQPHIINPTNPCRALDHGIQHWLHICRRTANDTQHFGGCGLMLQRLPQFRVGGLQLSRLASYLLKQMDILHRDADLICHGGDKPNLFRHKLTWLHASAVDRA